MLLSGGQTVTPTETTSYDADGNVSQQIDADGNVSQQIDADGNATESSYDPLGHLVAQTDPLSGTTIYTYTALEQTARQDPSGNVTTRQYDAAGRLDQTTDPTGATTQYQDDPAGNTVAITTGAPGAVAQVETRQYDALDRVVTDTVGAPGQPPSSTVTSYDQDGNVAQVEQPGGDVTFNTYDLNDQLATVEVDAAPVMTATAPTYAAYTYDLAGNQSGAEDFDGRLTTTSYDGADRATQTTANYHDVQTGQTTTTITTTYGDDPDGNTVSRQLQQTVGVPGGVAAQTTHSYTATVNADDWTASSGEDGLVTQYGYDAAGQTRTQTVLNLSPPVTTTLTADGQPEAIGESVGSATPYTSTFGYDASDRPLTATLPGGSGGIQQSMGYDGDGRLITTTLAGPSGVTNPLSSTYGYSYTPMGWSSGVTSTLNGVTSTVAYTHDALGRLVSVGGTGAGSVSEGINYDGDGNILSATSAGITTTYYYNKAYPNLLLATYTAGQPSALYYGYDATGHTLSITNTTGLSDTLSYDLLGRLVSVRAADGTLISQSYNSAGQRSSYLVTKNGALLGAQSFQYRGSELAEAVISDTQTYTVDTYLYDGRGWPLELIRVPKGQAPQRYWYEENGHGDVVALTDATGTVVDRYSYDAWGYPTSVREQVPQRLRYAGYWYD